MIKKTILITGASRGIGKQLALRYAAADVHLILVARQHEELSQVALRCEQLGATATYRAIDIKNAISIKAFIIETDNATPIDLIIANAGVSSTLQPHWQQETEEDIEHVFAINWQGTLNTISPLIDRMIARKKGQIAMVSSLAALRGLPQSPSYCASKAALLVYGQSLRAWLGRYNVRVNVICPGYIKTDMSDCLTGPKPFLISSERAAKIIQQGLTKNKACIAFPWALYRLMKLANILPDQWVNAIANRFESYRHT